MRPFGPACNSEPAVGYMIRTLNSRRVRGSFDPRVNMLHGGWGTRGAVTKLDVRFRIT
jgi:hypothetical protein